ncbi:MAG: hypothetical protein JO001_29705 [Alphaproteobacteria bacterium]|nr:hypothetical protein [Alphaproteobacteria bacterium]
MLWLILTVAAGLSLPPVVLMVDEATGQPVPEINPLLIGGLPLIWLLAVWVLVAICIAIPRRFVRIPILVLLLMPYLGWLQQLGDQGFFWSIIRPDMTTGEGYFDTMPERELAAAIVACDSHDEPSKCDFSKIDALARAANVNMIGYRGRSFMDLAIETGGFPQVVGSLLRAGETAGDVHRKAIHYACEQIKPDLVRAVIAAGVDPNLREPGGTPYMIRATAMPMASRLSSTRAPMLTPRRWMAGPR